LKQLLDSGMPADIDIGGKDLCGWAVDMGATKCHQLLLVSTSTNLAADENAHANENANANANANVQVNEDNAKPSDASMAPVAVEAPHCQEHNTPLTTTPSLSSPSPSFVVHRPNYDGDQETIPQLKNRLDELESLSLALSTCLDNLAEEVSVCNGLLLMGGGGASALASHVRSLRDWKQQKLDEIEKVNSECRDAERELADLVHSSNYKVNSNSNANANANANADNPPQEQQRRRLMDGINWDAPGAHAKKMNWGALRSDVANSLARYFGSVNSGSLGWCYGTKYHTVKGRKKESMCEPEMAKPGMLPWMTEDYTVRDVCP